MATGYLYDVWVPSCSYGSYTVQKIVNNSLQSTITVGNGPDSACVDKNNNIWVANYYSASVQEIINNVAQNPIMSGSSRVGSVCIDKNNNVWVTNFMSQSVSKIVDGTITQTIIVGSQPYCICCDKNNNIWVANYGGTTIQQIINGVAQSPIDIGGKPYGICCDLDNNIWVSVYSLNVVKKIVGSVVQSTINVGKKPAGICIDKNNNIWVSHEGDNTVQQIINDIAQTPITVNGIIPIIAGQQGISVDFNNDIWVMNYDANTVQRISNNIVQNPISVNICPTNLGDATGMQAAMLFGWIKTTKHLYKKGSNIWYYNNSWQSNTETLSESTFTTYGMDTLPTTLPPVASPDLLYYSDVLTSATNKITAVNSKLILAKGDIDLNSANNLNSVTLTANLTGSSAIKMIVSVDYGTTWKTFDGSNWNNITPTATNVNNNGISKTNFNAITKSQWSLLFGSTPTKIRFGYLLNQGVSTETCNTDSIAINIDMVGSWEVQLIKTDYKEFETGKNGDIITINLLSSGDFKLNY